MDLEEPSWVDRANLAAWEPVAVEETGILWRATRGEGWEIRGLVVVSPPTLFRFVDDDVAMLERRE